MATTLEPSTPERGLRGCNLSIDQQRAARPYPMRISSTQPGSTRAMRRGESVDLWVAASLRVKTRSAMRVTLQSIHAARALTANQSPRVILGALIGIGSHYSVQRLVFGLGLR